MFLETPTLAGTTVRLAWHSAGTYIAATGEYGSNGGHIQYESVLNWGSNAGLAFLVELLEPIYQRYDGLTRADLYILGGIVGVAFTDGPWVHFCGGREDLDEASAPPDEVDGQHLLPGAEDPRDDIPNFELNYVSEHITEVFARMGFDQQEMVALLAAHSIGRMHEDASGYIGTWDTTEFIMNNEYFTAVLNFPWGCYTLPNGLHQYAIDPDNPVNPDDPLPLDCSQPVTIGLDYNMNPADIALKTYPDFLPFTQLYASDESQMHRDFARAWNKLLMFGVTCDHEIEIVDIENYDYVAVDVFSLGEDGVTALLFWLVVCGVIVILLSALCLLAHRDSSLAVTAKPQVGLRANLMA